MGAMATPTRPGSARRAADTRATDRSGLREGADAPIVRHTTPPERPVCVISLGYRYDGRFPGPEGGLAGDATPCVKRHALRQALRHATGGAEPTRSRPGVSWR